MMSVPTRKRILIIGVFCAAFLIRIAIASHLLREQHDPQEMERTAISLATTGIYGNPYATATGPSAHVPPGFTLVLAAIFRVFGTGSAAQTVQALLACTLVAIRCALLTWLAGRRLGFVAAISTGLVAVAWIAALNTEVMGWWDTPATALALLALVTYELCHPLETLKPIAVAGYGIAWGAAALLNSCVLPVFAGLLVLSVIRRRSLMPARILLAVASCFLCLVPWGIRNQRALGKFILTRDNLGLELSLSYYPGASWNCLNNLDFAQRHPFYSQPESAQVARLGEVAYNSRKLDVAWAWAAQHAAEALRLVGLHAFHFWFPVESSPVHTVLQTVFMLLALMGGWLLWREDRALGERFVVLAVTFPLIYYVVQWLARYRYPIEWMLELCLGLFLAQAFEWLSQRRSATRKEEVTTALV